MILGALSDTHKDTANAIPHIMREFKKRGVEYIIHPGDIDLKHLKPELFLNLPVACALTEEQVNGDDKEGFSVPPKGWIFTRPGNRIVRLPNGEIIYVGHKLSSNFLMGSEAEMDKRLQEIRNQHDGLRLVFSGHTHHGIRFQGHLVTFVNPGAVEDSWDGHEFAIIDTDTGEIVFCRIPMTKLAKPDFSFAIISDSLDITEVDPSFWGKLDIELKKRGVKYIIHCGNISLKDVGREELKFYQVHYYLREDQDKLVHSDKKYVQPPENWHQITDANPIVEIEGDKFYVKLDLGIDLSDMIEFSLYKLSHGIMRKHPEIKGIFCGFTHNAVYEETELPIKFINPGDIRKGRNFTVGCHPRGEYTFGHVPFDPLPKIG